jgi:hypothetical protein
VSKQANHAVVSTTVIVAVHRLFLSFLFSLVRILLATIIVVSECGAIVIIHITVTG